MHIPINAKVECTDGPCGRIASLIVNPKAGQVTHVVVRDRSLRHVEHLLPLKDVRAIDDHSVQIDCSGAEVKSLERFTEIVYVDQADPQIMRAALEGANEGHNRWAQARPGLEMLMLGATDVPVEHELVPGGEVVLHRGSCVVASNGHMGRVEGLLIDLQTGKITHLVMREGHLWNRHELAVPLVEIERIQDDTVFLRHHQQTTEGRDGVPNSLGSGA